jgi:hypothetical protein
MSKSGPALLIAALVLLTGYASASQPSRELAGNYQLVGMMEMGSQLLLSEQGGFKAVLYYGNLDIYAQGQWIVQDGQVVLSVWPQPTPPKELLLPFVDIVFDHSDAAQQDGYYHLASYTPATHGGDDSIEVRWVFEDGSEQQTEWRDSSSGAVTLPLHEGKTLKKLGVRGAGSRDEFAWLETQPDERHFLIERTTGAASDLRTFFHKMTLTPQDRCLIMDMGDAKGCYQKRD